MVNNGVVLPVPDVGLCARAKKACILGIFWPFYYVEHIHIDRIFQRFFQKYSIAHKYSFEGDELWGKSRMSLNLWAKGINSMFLIIWRFDSIDRSVFGKYNMCKYIYLTISLHKDLTI